MRYLNHITLRHLQIFRAVVEKGSFSSAAEHLNLTQPTISLQIKKLSELVGQPLYVLDGKRIVLTDAGRELVPTSQAIDQSLEDFAMRLDELQGLKRGHLTLAAVSSAEYFLPRILGAFCQRYPQITVSIEISNRTNILQRLDQRMDDLYIFGQILSPEQLKADMIEFADNPVVIFAYPEHPLCKKKQIPYADLSEEPFILREAGCGTELLFKKLFQDKNIVLNSRLQLGSNQAVKQAVMGKLGISMLSQYAILNDVRLNQLKILDVQGFPTQDKWYLVAPGERRLSIVATTFQEFLLHEGRQIMKELLAC
ncbi:MAG: LysR family transcriptional regulator [Gammaproteobacteria bacterium]|nr:MAG: LysR family transcriptional regulator [Gammaproteobacteria bacterium]